MRKYFSISSSVIAVTSRSSSKTSLAPDCHNPACKSKIEMFQAAMKAVKTSTDGEEHFASEAQVLKNEKFDGISNSMCPVDKDELGRSSWNLLHSIAANYPDSPTELEKKQMKLFFEIFSVIYPCSYCAEDFQNCIKKDPPTVDSRESLSIWLCEQHNKVNNKIGKPLFSCDIKTLDEKWKTGTPACWK